MSPAAASRRLTARLREEQGWAILTAMLLMTLMLTGGATMYSIVNTQTGQSRTQRNRESAFNLAEAALNAQVFQVARSWPGAAGGALPSCDQTSSDTRCPDPQQLTGLLPAADATGATWRTEVHDNGDDEYSQFYGPAVLDNPGFDENRDHRVWVRATATAQGRTRTIVGLVRAQYQTENIPHAALISGKLDLSNNGNKAIIDASATGAPVSLRCTPALLDLVPCAGHLFGGGKYKDLGDLLEMLQTQITGAAVQTGQNAGPAMTVDARARMKATAVSDGTYYPTCPASLTGKVVYIESGNCSYTGNGEINSASDPGFVIQNQGTLYLGGTLDFHGVIYEVNATNLTGAVMQIQGNAQVFGGVLVDGNGLTIAGSSKQNIILDPVAYDAIESIGSAGVIQNTWREIR